MYPPKRNFGQLEVEALALKKFRMNLMENLKNFYISDRRYNYTDSGLSYHRITVIRNGDNRSI